MLFYILAGSFIAIVVVFGGYLLGRTHGYAEGRLLWKAVFQELRDFDERHPLTK